MKKLKLSLLFLSISLTIFSQKKNYNIGILLDNRTEQDAVIAACLQRFRPILLATFTTVLGLIPLYLSGGEMWEGMAISIMVGLLFGTVITLLIIPSLYSALFQFSYKNYEFNEKLLDD